ncbi:hypothetical protein M0R45_025469 [Rubus argutus]|uniref:Fe2OG dioxygenase domain-containing protein n=1 Tax=Rubus argutus TaxID=59490 RepID=A0AAW1WWJ5_RUBAR
MGLARFGRPKGAQGQLSPNLFVANCGPAVGLSHDAIAAAFGSFECPECIAWTPLCSSWGRTLHIRYSVLQPTSQDRVDDSVPVSLLDSELNIPGLYLFHDFVTANEEEELLAAVDERPWKILQKEGSSIMAMNFAMRQGIISILPKREDVETIGLDQLTVNEYPPGVGLSPHIDTHSAFEGLIFSLSLAGPCIMEFRRYFEGGLYLPPRSLLLLSGEARYAWHHYIPHHKIDKVKDSVIRRGSRRVSFTLRKVRHKVLANVNFPQYCDSQR